MPIAKQQRRQWLALIAVVGFLAFPLLVLLLNHDPHQLEHQASWCPSMLFFGLPCPGCGITKSLVFLYTADIVTSFRYHLLGPIAFIYALFIAGYLVIKLTTGRSWGREYIYNKPLAVGLALMLGMFHLVRLINYLSSNSLQDIAANSLWY